MVELSCDYSLSCQETYLEVNINFDVQIPDIPGVGLQPEHAIDLLPLGAGEVFLQVEHGLFPVSVGGLGCCGEPNSLVAVSELHVEESDESLQNATNY